MFMRGVSLEATSTLSVPFCHIKMEQKALVEGIKKVHSTHKAVNKTMQSPL